MGNPFANWLIEHQYPNAIEPQATAPEFGATLPGETTPPDNGQGGTVKITKQEKVTVEGWKGWTPGQAQIRVKSNNGSADVWSKFQNFTLPDVVSDDIRGIQIVIPLEKEVEPENPSPPPVVLTLPQGSKGVDVSAYQPFFWTVVDIDDMDFAWFRCSDGMNTSATSDYHDADGYDLELGNNVAVLHSSGKPWWIYHFLRETNVTGQISKVQTILGILEERGTPPRQAVLEDGSLTPHVAIDVENFNLTNAQVKQFYDALTAVGYTVAIYTSNYFWSPLATGENWWSDVFCVFADYYKNDGTIPPRAPILPPGFNAGHVWQYSSKTGDIYSWSNSGLDGDVVGPYPASAPTPPTPPADTVDLLAYLRGPDGLQYDTDGKTYTQTYQYRHEANDGWKLVKGNNGQYEMLYADSQFIYRREDTSQGNDKFYVHSTNGTPGAAWCKRFMAVGETSTTTKEVTHYWDDCSVRIPTSLVVDNIRLNAVYPTYTFAGTNQTLNDVVELEWLDGWEKYWFAKGWGLVGFTDDGMTSEFMNGPLQGRDDLPIVVPGCIDLSGRFYV